MINNETSNYTYSLAPSHPAAWEAIARKQAAGYVCCKPRLVGWSWQWGYMTLAEWREANNVNIS